jgi:hypothetical protein
VHALERVASLRATLGDGRDLSTIRRDVLTRSIFGVDVNPTAVWLCELRLWLSVVIESEMDDPLAVTPLPNLDRNVRTGDALSGRAFGSPEIVRDGKQLRDFVSDTLARRGVAGDLPAPARARRARTCCRGDRRRATRRHGQTPRRTRRATRARLVRRSLPAVSGRARYSSRVALAGPLDSHASPPNPRRRRASVRLLHAFSRHRGPGRI